MTNTHRRSRWLTLAALGLVASVLPLTGIIAGTTDTAETGPNSASSRAEPASADVQLARGGRDASDAASPFACGDYSENLATGFFEMTGLTEGGGGLPNVDAVHSELCVRNVGAAPVDVRLFVADRAETDPECTGDEASFDETCGSGAGELGQVLLAHVGADASCDGNVFSRETNDFATLEVTGHLLGSIAPGQQLCVQLSVEYPDVSNALLQQAQSDLVTWRFTVEATATGA